MLVYLWKICTRKIGQY